MQLNLVQRRHALGEQLPCIVNSHDNEALREITQLSGAAWIGYSELDGTWQWQYGCASSYTNWNPSEPSDGLCLPWSSSCL